MGGLQRTGDHKRAVNGIMSIRVTCVGGTGLKSTSGGQAGLSRAASRWPTGLLCMCKRGVKAGEVKGSMKISVFWRIAVDTHPLVGVTGSAAQKPCCAAVCGM